MGEQREGTVVPDHTELLEDLEDDLDRVELWTAALGSFQQLPPEYRPDIVRAAEGVMVPRTTGVSLGDVVRSAFRNQPYIAITIALGFGWLLGRMHRAL